MKITYESVSYKLLSKKSQKFSLANGFCQCVPHTNCNCNCNCNWYGYCQCQCSACNCIAYA